MIKLFIGAFLCVFGKNKLSILTYHRVGKSGNAIAMDEQLFEKHLFWVKKYFTPISLSEGLELQAKGSLPRGAIAITVDDGYADTYTTIFPLLKKHGLTATFFISTIGYEQGYLWDERVSFLIMTTELKTIDFCGSSYSLKTHDEKIACLLDCQAKIKYRTITERHELIEQLALKTEQNKLPQQFISQRQTVEMYKAGMGIGAHTHSHPILMKENSEIALDEITLSKSVLEGIINAPIKYFAYPNGKYGVDFDAKHIEMVKEVGFIAALSTDKGILQNRELDGFQIKRFTPWDEAELKFILRLAVNYCQ